MRKYIRELKCPCNYNSCICNRRFEVAITTFSDRKMDNQEV
jgi:hypothetical protein